MIPVWVLCLVAVLLLPVLIWLIIAAADILDD